MTTSPPSVAPTTGTTRVTGRRIVQYIVDVFLAGLVLGIIGLLLNLMFPGAGFERVVTGLTSLSGLTAVSGGVPSLAAGLLTFAVWATFFIIVPIARDRTPAMMLLGLRIVRVEGGSPSAGQHTGRALLLVVDTLVAGLVGFIVILCSRHRQRVGDHAAGTLVIRD